MPQAHKTSSLIILSLIFLLPLFFVPGGAPNLLSAKSALLILGVLLTLIFFMFESWRKGSLSVPKHYFLVVAMALPLVYFLSALLSTPSSLSLFGYSFEVGTFGFVLLGSVVLILAAIILSDSSSALQALTAFFLSISLIAVFVSIKLLLGGDVLVWGNFFGNMGNPLGNWTDLAMVFGLFSIFVALVLGMIQMRTGVRLALYIVFILSTALLAIINFSTAFALTLILSILLSLYFWKIERDFLQVGENTMRPMILPTILTLVSLLFLINPGGLNGKIFKSFNIQNTEVRPSLSATLGISKAVLSQGALLGSGPNTFSHDWLIYKPVNVNATPFWGVAFPFGAGFIPTQIASTGILGTALWLIFFVFFIVLGIKALSRVPESRAPRFIVISSLLISTFLWGASFFYTPSGTMLMLAFIFSGLFVAQLAVVHIIPYLTLSMKASAQNRLASLVLLTLLAAGTVSFGWIGFEKTASAYHWKKALDLSNTAGASLLDVENELIKAANIAPADIHYVALSRLNFTKAQIAASATTSVEKNQALFQESVSRSIEAARLAVSVNPAGPENWATLGTVYSALVPKPLAVEGAYENAKFAYNEALKRNPSNPELYLSLAQLELNSGDTEAARSYIRSSIALKDDYADAYLMLAQLEVTAGNVSAAIASAERLAALVPNNPGLYFELGLLKYSNGDYIGAEKALIQALVLSPEYANAKYYFGLTLAQLSRFSEAQSEFEDLLKTNPGNIDIKNAIDAVSRGRVPTLKTQ